MVFCLFILSSFIQASQTISLNTQQWDSNDLPALSQVTPSFLRGGRPTALGIKKLKEMGIKTIVNLENDDEAILEEQQWAKKAGIEFHSIPLSWFFSPSEEDVSLALNLINDPTKTPVFLHCQHGEDRTGLIVGLYRVYLQEWSPQQAYQEMLDFNFHPILLGLDNYFREKTNLNFLANP